MKSIIILLFLFFFTSAVFSQKDKDWKWQDQDWIDYFKNGKPTVEFSYGQSHLTLKNSPYDFNSSGYFGFGLVELKLGYSYAKQTVYSKKIVQFRNSLFHGSIISQSLRMKDSYSVGGSTTRFGFQSATGYGYRLGKQTALILYNTDGITWTNFYFPPPVMLFEEDPYYNNWKNYIEPFDRHFRFGSTTEAGIRIPIGTMVNFNISFDRTIVFPRHLVWKYLGSTLIVEAMSHALIDNFVRAIMRSTPGAGPIVSFLLKGGLSYGIYELRRGKMNWPFESSEPLLFDSFKAGVSFTF